MIEALTYRLEAHTNSDDPSRYREKSEEAVWRALDPIERLRNYLVSVGALDDETLRSISEEAEALAAATRDAMNETPVLDPLELFEHVYLADRPGLSEQREFLARELENQLTPANPGSPA